MAAALLHWRPFFRRLPPWPPAAARRAPITAAMTGGGPPSSRCMRICSCSSLENPYAPMRLCCCVAGLGGGTAGGGGGATGAFTRFAAFVARGRRDGDLNGGYSKRTRDPDRRRRRCFHAKFTTPGLTKWCRRKQGVSCTRCCSYFSAILRCGYNRRDPPPADPSQHGARDGKQKLQQSKSNIPPHVQNPATIKRPYAHPT